MPLTLAMEDDRAAMPSGFPSVLPSIIPSAQRSLSPTLSPPGTHGPPSPALLPNEDEDVVWEEDGKPMKPPGTPSAVLAAAAAPRLSINANGSGITAFHALAAYLEEQHQRSEYALRQAHALMNEMRMEQQREMNNLSQELRSLHALQLEHAKISVSEASKRHSESVSLDQRVKGLDHRMAEVDEAMTFCKDTLYSVLTANHGAAGLPQQQPAKTRGPREGNKVMLKPIRQMMMGGTKPPWNASAHVEFDPAFD